MNTQLEGLLHFFQNFSVEMLVSNAFYASLTMGNKAINQKVWQMQLFHRVMSSPEEQNQCQWINLDSFKKHLPAGQVEIKLFAQRGLCQLYKQGIPSKALPAKIFLCNKLVL